MVTTIQQTDTYRQVFAWLRGGDATPDPQMENDFLDLITARLWRPISPRLSVVRSVSVSPTRSV